LRAVSAPAFPQVVICLGTVDHGRLIIGQRELLPLAIATLLLSGIPASLRLAVALGTDMGLAVSVAAADANSARIDLTEALFRGFSSTKSDVAAIIPRMQDRITIAFRALNS